jgi:hypothetical protein
MGIEEAALDQEVEPLSCYNPPNDPTVYCPTCNEGCVSDCHPEECLADQECRKGLWHYLKCIGDDCQDNASNCGGCLSRSAKLEALQACAIRCDGCDVAGAISICEGYCACMQSRCGPSIPGGNESSCMTTCLQGAPPGQVDPYGQFAAKPEPWLTYCLWMHCEAAPTPTNFHCQHAIGRDDLCPAPQPVDPDAIVCEYPKGYGNAACNSDDDCCSTCRPDVGVCNPP